MTERTKIEYRQTGDITGELYVNGSKVRATSFRFEHKATSIPKAIIEIVDPDVVITTIDCHLVKRTKLNKLKSLFCFKKKGDR